ncbi:E3 Ubiquitin ligase [Rubidibacter lacunae KORDI 51-2]|uniref:RING-type E3 ubiquitin transferase n=1 Tax=Rubidibacter lacunae KORDI 51-2 TaxID=582515 RepID=U5DBU1_9CHRO|nr:E3 ubiquitin ligase family protein [Rubidibacter lacunae]ERN41998.1 E3 Ubiquitin ligase [Rubidibacter lacunae KORDI 51-2]
MPFLVIGAIAFIIAGIVLRQWRSTLGDSRAMLAAETYNVSNLEELSRAIADELGSAGSFRQTAEVKGIIHCEQPLMSELSQRHCVYSRTNVIEQCEHTYYEEDGEGNSERKTREESNTLAESDLKIDFQLEDDTGTIQISLDGAEIDAIEVVDRFEVSRGESISFGGFSFDPTNRLPVGTDSKRILGYQFNEWILPVGQYVYVLGEVSDSDGILKVQKPSNPGDRFLITYKTEEQLTQHKQSVARKQQIGGFVAFAVGVVCVIAWLMTGN